MSTKIYDAYRINIRTMSKLNNFIQKIKAYQTTQMKNYMARHMAAKIAKLSDTCYLTQHPIQGITPPENLTVLAENHPRINNQSLFMSAVSLVQDNIQDRRKQWFEEQSICVFPQDDNHICCMVFGSPLTHLFQTYCSGKADAQQKALFEDMILEDYHYQNQTDRPESITEKEWEQRRNDWNRMLQSGIPARDGIFIIILSQDTYENLLYSITYDDIIQHPNLTPEQRAQKLAYDSVLQNYINQQTQNQELTMSHYLQLNTQFRTAIKDTSSDVCKNIETMTDMLTKTLPVITKTALSTPLKNLYST